MSRIPFTDYLRSGPRPTHPHRPWKEWTHFVVLAPQLSIVVNFSFTVERGEMVPRLTLIVAGAGLAGDVDRYSLDACSFAPGKLALRFGNNDLWFADGVYRVRAALRSADISVDLTLKPLARPTATGRLPFRVDSAVHWLVYPRLTCSGTVQVRGKAVELNDVAAYHDHNWGEFAWGDDFVWEWGFAVPDEASNPWSLVFSRVSTKARHTTRSKGLFLWRGSAYHRLFLEEAVQYEPVGQLTPRALLHVPRVGGLLRPGTAFSVPEKLRVRARQGDDWLDCLLTFDDLIQVVIPDEVDPLGTVAINEVGGRITVEGCVLGEQVALEGPTVTEFVRG